MRLIALALMVCCALTLGAGYAGAQLVEMFGGYSYVHASVPVTSAALCPGPTCPAQTFDFHPNLNGWELAGTTKPGTWFA